MSLDRCSIACNGSAAIGSMADRCFCMRRALTLGTLDDYLCSTSCSGDTGHLCGSGEASYVSVYRTPHNLPFSSFTVAGAGSEEWNGVYRQTSHLGGLSGEVRRYDLDSTHSLVRLKGAWQLAACMGQSFP